jgi:DNA-binding NarL/FixJ family response regulator
VKILVVEDNLFINSMLVELLEATQMEVTSAIDFVSALKHLEEAQPNVLLTDLDLGSGPSGIDLTYHVQRNYPWIAIVILSTHRSPDLAVLSGRPLPKGVSYIVKNDLTKAGNLVSIIRQSLVNTNLPAPKMSAHYPALTSQQAEVLHLIAQGLSNQSIAQRRGVSLRAAESIIAKLYEILGVKDNSSNNPRVVAAEIWKTGQVVVK